MRAATRRRPALVLGGLLAGLGALLVLADLAPWAATRAGRGAGVAMACRLALAPTCHQRPERCLRVQEVPLAACARCCGLHAGGLAGGLMVLALAAGGMRRRSLFRDASWPRKRAGRGVALAAGILLADVALGIAWPAWDLPLLRFATGLGFTVIAAWAAAGRMASDTPAGAGDAASAPARPFLAAG